MPKKIHILYTIPNFDTAGSGKVLYDLAKHLDKDKFRISIVCKHNKGAFFKEVEALGLPIYFMDVTVPLRPYYNLIQRLKSFKTFLTNKKVDIVHSWHWSSDWSEPLACRLVGVKFVYTKKAMGWGNVHWKIRSFLSHFIVTVNTDMQAFFSYKKQQKLIPFGLDTSYFNPELYKPKNQSEIFKLITVANLVPIKNIETIIRAIEKLKSLPIHLDIVGDTRGSYTLTLQKLVNDLKLENQVFFLGKHTDVRTLLVNADLYIISSKNEGMPMALVEAMSMSLPVLGSNISGIRYVLQDFDDLLFPVSDIKTLVNKIELIYKQTPHERKELGESLRNYCLKYFSQENFIKNHENLYLKIL